MVMVIIYDHPKTILSLKLSSHSHDPKYTDEAHCRDVDSDLLCLCMKRLLSKHLTNPRNPIPKIILMSATINAQIYVKYFSKVKGGEGRDKLVKKIDISSGLRYGIQVSGCRLYQNEIAKINGLHIKAAVWNVCLGYVQVKYLDELEGVKAAAVVEFEERMEDASRTQQVPAYLNTQVMHLAVNILASDQLAIGDTALCFLPGEEEVKRMKGMIDRQKIPGMHIVQLYSKGVQERGLPDVLVQNSGGVKLVIIATNIAESSVTFPGVKMVFDFGLVKKNQMNKGESMARLSQQWISKASARQRMGRTGYVNTVVVKLVVRLLLQHRLHYYSPEVGLSSLSGKHVALNPQPFSLCFCGTGVLAQVSATDYTRDISIS